MQYRNRNRKSFALDFEGVRLLTYSSPFWLCNEMVTIGGWEYPR